MSPVPSSTAPVLSAPAESEVGGTSVNASPEVLPELNRAQLCCNNSQKSVHQAILSPSLKRVLLFIDQNYMQKLTLEIVASRVYLNKTYISQMFTKHLGMSFVTYLEDVRISKAKELLYTTNMSVSEIAYSVGYASQSYFSKVFIKRVGITPSQYRLFSLNAD